MKANTALSVIIAMLLIATPLSVLSGTALAKGNLPVTFAGGSGTIGDPYIIENVWELQGMSSILDAHYALGNDINASMTNIWNSGDGFAPVGTNTNNFVGSLDGKGFSIIDLYINRTSTDYIGLFGYMGGSGTVRNVSLVDVAISGNAYVGGLAGQSSGSIENCSVAGNVSGTNGLGLLVGQNFPTGIVLNCYATGNASGSSSAGGFVGINQGTISRSYATANVTGTSNVGGFVGWNLDGTVSSSYATGNVYGTIDYVGGLVGLNNGVGTITNCYATGNVSGTAASTGGFSGSNAGTITACFWDTQTSGLVTSAGGTGRTTAQMMNINTFIAATWNFASIWDIENEISYPYFRTTAPYTIYDISDLQGMSSVPAGDWTLANDIDASATATWNSGAGFAPVENFIGSFEGGGHTITGLTINYPWKSRVGLFAYLGAGSIVSNVSLLDSTVTGKEYVGGLAGQGESLTVKWTVHNCHSAGTLNGTALATTDCFGGGLIGYMLNGDVSNCSADMTIVSAANTIGGLIGFMGYAINNVSHCYATGNVSGAAFVGGLVGLSYEDIPLPGLIRDCYATGNVSGSFTVGGFIGLNVGTGANVNNSYSTGNVTGSLNVGGFAGRNIGVITDCFWDTDTSGTLVGIGADITAGATGRTTAQMMQQATFTDAGWNFTDVWGIVEDMTYPYLLWDETDFPPVAEDDLYGTTEDDAITILSPGLLENDHDMNDDALTVIACDIASAYSAEIIWNPNGSFTYDPTVPASMLQDLAVGEYRMDFFDYTISDGKNSSTATAFVNVTGVNDAPDITSGDVLEAVEHQAYSMDYNALDIDTNDTLTWALASNATWLGIADITGVLSGTAEPGIFYVSVIVDDGNGGLDWSNFTLTVANVNDAPVAGNAAYDINEKILLNVAAPGLLDHATDPDAGDTLTVVPNAFFTTKGAAVVMNADGSFTYDPRTSAKLQTLAEGEWEHDSFNYTVSDGSGVFDVGTVDVNVTGANDASEIASDNVLEAVEGVTYSVSYIAQDVDANDTHIWAVTSNATWLTMSTAGTLSGTPEPGMFYVNVTVDDGNGGSDWSNFTLTAHSDADGDGIPDYMDPDFLKVIEYNNQTVNQTVWNNATVWNNQTVNQTVYSNSTVYQNVTVGVSDADTDNDGWTDAEEILADTDPLDATDMPVDTDGDGIADFMDPEEAQTITDTETPVWAWGAIIAAIVFAILAAIGFMKGEKLDISKTAELETVPEQPEEPAIPEQ